MEQLQFLISISIALLVILVVIVILALIKRSKKLFLISLFSLLLFIGSSVYTVYFGFFLGVNKAFEIKEEIFPHYDSETPDTEANKKHFKSFLNIDISPDIKNIYCFDDAIGIDSDYMFSFTCDSLTAKNIIETNKLKKNDTLGNNPGSLQHDFVWWDKKRIDELESYSWNSNSKGKNYHKIFWYDKKNRKAYYFEYYL